MAVLMVSLLTEALIVVFVLFAHRTIAGSHPHSAAETGSDAALSLSESKRGNLFKLTGFSAEDRAKMEPFGSPDFSVPKANSVIVAIAPLKSVGAWDRENREDGKRIKRSLWPVDSPVAREVDASAAIPPEYIVVVSLGIPVNRLNQTALLWLRKAFSSFLNIPVNNVCIDKIRFHGNVVEIFFIKSGRSTDRFTLVDLIPSREVIKPGIVEIFQQEVPALNITQIHPQKEIILTYTEPFWMQVYFPYVAAACSVVVILLIATLIYCCCKKKEKKLPEEDPTTRQIFYPTLKPDIKNPMMVQPDDGPVYVAKGCVTPVPAQPVRVKKKLLESRRGSNASLTLDLTASPEMARWDGTPPKESTGLEYMLSAGNRLSRRDLRNAIKNTHALYEEFWEIPMNHPEKVYVAGSGMKNRYRTIIPNEHSRVELPDLEWDPLSSYINANYIRGYEGEPHAYVATQGPMTHTLVDFWGMIWNEKAPIIVMITKLKEKDKPKCENYLPEDYSWATYGDIDVKVERVVQKQGYTVRHLLLRCRGESLCILHYWYTAWPDHKPPVSPRMLIELVKDVELHRYNNVKPRGPVIVHCSAGIGRTGCFIAISIGMRQLREEQSVDVLGVVCSMRIDRGGMIQTHEQYEFIHQALCEYEKELAEPVGTFVGD